MLRALLAIYGLACFGSASLVAAAIPAAMTRAHQLPPAMATLSLFTVGFAVVLGWVCGSAFIGCAVFAQRQERRNHRR